MSNFVADVPLSERKDKKGNKNIEVIDIAFYNEKGERVNEVFTGHFLRIEFAIKKKPDIDLSKMIVACNLCDQSGNAAVSWISDEMPHNFSTIANTFSLEIPSLSLRPNVYSLRYLICHNTTNQSDFCDLLENAVQITVLNDSFFGGSYLLRENRGYSPVLSAVFK